MPDNDIVTDNQVTAAQDTETGGVDRPTGSYKSHHAKILRIEVSVGKDDGEDGRTIEEFEAAVKDALFHKSGVNAHRVCVQGAYYIIDGAVCLPRDYDPITKNRKPGTFPPMWAGGPDPRSQPQPIVTRVAADDGDREFVHVTPTAPRRDPVTGVKPRKARSDKGVKRGPRKDPEDKLKATAAISKMHDDFFQENK